jgi:hypothetical protein
MNPYYAKKLLESGNRDLISVSRDVAQIESQLTLLKENADLADSSSRAAINSAIIGTTQSLSNLSSMTGELISMISGSDKASRVGDYVAMTIKAVGELSVMVSNIYSLFSPGGSHHSSKSKRDPMSQARNTTFSTSRIYNEYSTFLNSVSGTKSLWSGTLQCDPTATAHKLWFKYEVTEVKGDIDDDFQTFLQSGNDGVVLDHSKQINDDWWISVANSNGSPDTLASSTIVSYGILERFPVSIRTAELTVAWTNFTDKNLLDTAANAKLVTFTEARVNDLPTANAGTVRPRSVHSVESTVESFFNVARDTLKTTLGWAFFTGVGMLADPAAAPIGIVEGVLAVDASIMAGIHRHMTMAALSHWEGSLPQVASDTFDMTNTHYINFYGSRSIDGNQDTWYDSNDFTNFPYSDTDLGPSGHNRSNPIWLGTDHNQLVEQIKIRESHWGQPYGPTSSAWKYTRAHFVRARVEGGSNVLNTSAIPNVTGTPTWNIDCPLSEIVPDINFLSGEYTRTGGLYNSNSYVGVAQVVYARINSEDYIIARKDAAGVWYGNPGPVTKVV